MSVAVGIVAHPRRQAMAEQLSAHIDADFVSFDTGGELGCNRNHVRTWTELADSDTEFGLVCEDDCIPVIDFRHQLDMVLTVCPTDVCSIYLGRLRPPQHQAAIHNAVEKAKANDSCFIVGDHLFHAVAVAMKTELIPDMLAGLHSYLPIDESIGQWARRTQHPIAYTAPSLVEHNDSTPTLAFHRDGAKRTPGRTAWHVGSRRTWTDSTVTL